MTTCPKRPPSDVAHPNPAYNSDRSKVVLYDGLLELSLMPGSRLSDDYPIYGAFVPVTAKLAIALVENQNLNRKVTKTGLARYTSDMLNESWELTSQGIQLDEDGELQDGQHRCFSIIEASERSGRDDIAPVMFISMGYPAESMLAVDTGIKRRTTASAKFAGITMRPGEILFIETAQDQIASAMNTHWELNGASPNMTNSSKIRFIQKYADPIESVTSKENSISYCNHGAIRGVLANAMITRRHDHLAIRRLDSFKGLLDQPYGEGSDGGTWSSYVEPGDTSPDLWPVLIRRLFENGVGKSGIAYRLQIAKQTAFAIERFLAEDDCPRASGGSLIKVSVKPTDAFLIPTSEPEWNDNSWRAIIA